jgi:glycosyltransferase involved in cell wall biosynthesis
MRVIHFIPGISQEASGPSYSVVRLCESLIDMGADVTLAAMDLPGTLPGPSFARLFPPGLGPRRLGRAPQMYRWLERELSAGDIDVLHSHGMWQMNSVYPGWAAQGPRARLMVSPRGAFSQWAMTHGSRFKRLFWPLVQRPALARAFCFHSTSDSEYDDIRRLGFRQPVAYIPNAVDVPAALARPPRPERTLLFLGRIHPVKGVDILLRAWSVVMGRHPHWRLRIVGTDASYQGTSHYLDEMRQLSQSLGLKRVDFDPPAYGEAKWRAYGDADLFALPTLSESFGMTVAESLAAGTPVIVTTAAPWCRVQEHGCGWSIGLGVEPLAAALEAAMAKSPSELLRLGENGRRWMLAEFSWPAIAERMHRTYEWMKDAGTPPAWVSTN